jgi:hypothetical protein
VVLDRGEPPAPEPGEVRGGQEAVLAVGLDQDLQLAEPARERSRIGTGVALAVAQQPGRAPRCRRPRELGMRDARAKWTFVRQLVQHAPGRDVRGERREHRGVRPERDHRELVAAGREVHSPAACCAAGAVRRAALARRTARGRPTAPARRAGAGGLAAVPVRPGGDRVSRAEAIGHGVATALRQDGRVLGVLLVVAGYELLPGEPRFVDALRDLVGMLVEDQRRIAALEHRLARIAALSAS